MYVEIIQLLFIAILGIICVLSILIAKTTDKIEIYKNKKMNFETKASIMNTNINVTESDIERAKEMLPTVYMSLKDRGISLKDQEGILKYFTSMGYDPVTKRVLINLIFKEQ